MPRRSISSQNDREIWIDPTRTDQVPAAVILMPRFVILRHEMPASEWAGTHWDFMLEQNGVLRTWALSEEPQIGREIAASQLADHRLAYLDYEGPISGNRGGVTQWDAGEYEFLSSSADEIKLRLRGRRLEGTIALSQQSGTDQRWRFSFSTCASGDTD